MSSKKSADGVPPEDIPAQDEHSKKHERELLEHLTDHVAAGLHTFARQYPANKLGLPGLDDREKIKQLACKIIDIGYHGCV